MLRRSITAVWHHPDDTSLSHRFSRSASGATEANAVDRGLTRRHGVGERSRPVRRQVVGDVDQVVEQTSHLLLDGDDDRPILGLGHQGFDRLAALVGHAVVGPALGDDVVDQRPDRRRGQVHTVEQPVADRRVVHQCPIGEAHDGGRGRERIDERRRRRDETLDRIGIGPTNRRPAGQIERMLDGSGHALQLLVDRCRRSACGVGTTLVDVTAQRLGSQLQTIGCPARHRPQSVGELAMRTRRCDAEGDDERSGHTENSVEHPGREPALRTGDAVQDHGVDRGVGDRQVLVEQQPGEQTAHTEDHPDLPPSDTERVPGDLCDQRAEQEPADQHHRPPDPSLAAEAHRHDRRDRGVAGGRVEQCLREQPRESGGHRHLRRRPPPGGESSAQFAPRHAAARHRPLRPRVVEGVVVRCVVRSSRRVAVPPGGRRQP
jgi:hypothetical protein